MSTLRPGAQGLAQPEALRAGAGCCKSPITEPEGRPAKSSERCFLGRGPRRPPCAAGRAPLHPGFGSIPSACSPACFQTPQISPEGRARDPETSASQYPGPGPESRGRARLKVLGPGLAAQGLVARDTSKWAGGRGSAWPGFGREVCLAFPDPWAWKAELS